MALARLWAGRAYGTNTGNLFVKLEGEGLEGWGEIVAGEEPFYSYETVGTANAPSWQALAAKSHVAIESYQSGTEVWNSGGTNASRLAWAQGKYQNSKNTYLAVGVPESRIFVSEHFANNNAITDTGAAAGWGRAGLASAADWDTVIQLRQDAMSCCWVFTSKLRR